MLNNNCPGCTVGSPAVIATATLFLAGTLTTLKRPSSAVPIPVTWSALLTGEEITAVVIPIIAPLNPSIFNSVACWYPLPVASISTEVTELPAPEITTFADAPFQVLSEFKSLTL